jgi:hypothetical protein
MKWRNEDQRNRVTSAINTLIVMITFQKWQEARAIVEHEIKWNFDPEPDITYHGFTGWAAVHNAILHAQQGVF